MATQDEKIKFIFDSEDRASGKMNSIALALTGINQAMQIGQTIAMGLKKAWNFAESLAPLLDVKNAFEALTRSAGMAGDAVLESMEKATNGMVPAAELMQTFNLAANLVGTKTARMLVDGLGDVSKIALATGQDVGYLFNSLVTGVGRESKMILDNLGITEDIITLKERYAESIGKTVDQLTAEEGKIALATAALDALKQKAADLPETEGTATQAFANFNKALEDAKLIIAEELLPSMIPLVQQLADMALEWLPRLIPVFEFFIDQMGKSAERADTAQQLIFILQYRLNQLWQVAVKVIKWFDKMNQTFGGLALPSWLTPGSPMPLETGLWGVADAAKDVTKRYQVMARKFGTGQSFRDLNPEIGMAARAGMGNFSYTPGSTTAAGTAPTAVGGGGGGGSYGGSLGGGLGGDQVIRLLKDIRDGVEELPDKMYEVNQELISANS